ncbi:Hypothetical protein, putative [Bodo saltans]|uniref:Uncharacterized protein n=1 Tax=Bodo saltans TaxID=75058 RepID=A0A0S4J751_BODSA|nr:Hypothetical protein, putative [Bodo saltans]|eukprot:CUG86275.1 Hypothetical protein, putative [Bodo saltans]
MSVETIRLSEMSTMRRSTKHRLQEDMKERLRRAAQQEQHDDVATGDVFADGLQGRRHAATDAPTANNVAPTLLHPSPIAVRDNRPWNQQRPSVALELSEPAHHVSGSCPLPVLHPWKWQEKMSWGVRKPFVFFLRRNRRTDRQQCCTDIVASFTNSGEGQPSMEPAEAKRCARII